jgi:hypothetical protein
MKIMNTKPASRIICKLLALGLAIASPIGSPAKVGEQENWYLAKEWNAPPNAKGVDCWKDPTSGKELIFVGKYDSNDDYLGFLHIYDFDGNLLSETFVKNGITLNDVQVAEDGSVYIATGNNIYAFDNQLKPKWTQGGYGPDDGEFLSAQGIAIGPNGDIFVADERNHRIQVLDPTSGAFKRKFGAQGDAPGQFQSPTDLAFLPDGRLVVGGSLLNFFKADGTFLSRKTGGSGQGWLSVCRDGKFLAKGYLRDGDGENIVRLDFIGSASRTAWRPNGDIVESGNGKIRIWKRAYRTKGLPAPNVIPQPVVRAVAQRPGTNILDIDFEILDSDDATATAGLVASVNGNFDDLTQLIAPTAWTDGTESKIGAPIATNQVHRVSWYVKGDWEEQTGDLKIGVLARDARRTKPVDLHFLELPFDEGKLTISRSPLKDTDVSNFLLYELAKGSAFVSLQYGKIMDSEGKILAENSSGGGIICTASGRDYFMSALGYRWATIGEVAMAKEAATPGTVNQFAATNQVKPRNLPGKVNEYGFDVGDHGTRAWWVVKQNDVETLKFSVDHSFKDDLDMNQSNSFYGRALALSENHHIIIGQGGGNVIPRYFHSQPSAFLNDLSGIIPTDGLSSGFGVSGTIGIGDSEISKAIAIDGDILAVGSSGENAVYLFKLSGPNGERFEQKARITPSNNEQGQNFGLTVALDGNILVVGAPFNNANGYGASGCAYVFRINEDFTYTQLAKLSNPAGEENDQFGYALTVSDGIIAIGANDYQRMASHGDHGVFLYKVEGDKVRQTQLITPPGGNYVGLDHFGNSMAIENNLLFVGSVWGQAVSIFTLNADGTAQFIKNIKTPNPTEEGLFGISIAAHNDMLVIGASGEYSESSIRDGVAYVYRVLPDGRATLLDRLSHPESQQLSGFGTAVSITSSGVLVGAPGFDLSESEPNVGSAVLFRFSK